MKAPKTPDLVKLNRNPNGVWERTIGRTKCGLKRFRFPTDETTAKMECWKIWLRWDQRPEGCESWDDLEKAENNRRTYDGYKIMATEDWKAKYFAIIEAAEKKAFEEKEAIEKTRWESKSQAIPGLTIQNAKDRWLESQHKRIGLIGSLGIGQPTYDLYVYRINRALEFLPVTQFSQLDYKTIETAVYAIASRPSRKAGSWATKETQKRQKKMALSQSSALSLIKTLKMFLDWCDEDGSVGYAPPRHVQKLFGIRPEAEEQEIKVLEPQDFGKLWAKAENEKANKHDNGKRRLLFLMLGLNCGFNGIDVRTLNDSHIKTENGQSYIWKLRNKTRKTNTKLVRTKWLLWPETKALLDEFMPVKMTTNSMRLAWQRLCKSAGVKIAHKYLRKTGAMFMERHGGLELQKMYLAHARGGAADNYSHPHWQHLSDALTAFRAEYVLPNITETLPKAKAA